MSYLSAMKTQAFMPESDYKTLFNSIPGLYLILTPDLMITAVSDAYLEATMTKREEIIGRHLFQVFPDNPNDPNTTGVRNLQASLDRVKQSKKPDAMPMQKYDIRRPESQGGTFEERYWSPLNSPILNEAGEIIYIIHRAEDITEFVNLKKVGHEQQQLTKDLMLRAEKMEYEVFLRTQEVAESSRQLKEANLELFKLNEKLKSANQELESFSYSVSHDLRAPLRAIHGFSHILKEQYLSKIDDEGKRLLKVIEDNVSKMSQLIDDLLAFSKLGRQVLRCQQIDMAALAREVFNEQLLINPQRDIDLEINSIPNCHGDQSLIKQVWVNLISNAIKYTKQRPKALIKISAQESPVEIIYQVADNGVGFEMAYVGKLFGVFQRLHTEKEFEGTGVGLAIVRQIIQRHGGRVWAESKINEGAKFYFSVPKEVIK